MAEQQTQEAPDTQVEETEQEQQQEQPEEQPQTNLDDPILSTLWEDLGVKEPEAEEEAEPEAEPETKAEAEPEAEPEKKEFSIKPKMDEETFRKVVREELESRGKDPEEVAEQQVTQQVEAKEDPYESRLIDEQKEELELYRYAEEKGHEGMSNKLLGFYKGLDEYVDSARKDDPDRTFDDEDEEFIEYVKKHKPEITPKDREALRRSKFRDEVVSDVKSEYKETIDGLKGELNQLRVRPEVLGTMKEAARAYDEFSKLDELKDTDPLAHKVFNDEKEKYLNWSKAFLDRWHGINTTVDEDFHVMIEAIDSEAKKFEEAGGEAVVREGKRFLTPGRFADAKDKSGYWTWNQSEILERFGEVSIENAHNTVAERVKEMESYGYKRGVVSGQSKKSARAGEPTPMNPPKASRTSSPGAAEGGEASLTPGAELLEELGIDFAVK